MASLMVGNSGLLTINKPPGITSYDVIRRLKKLYPGEKIGHGGTLDPFAEGVLVVGVGRAGTRQLGIVLKDTLKEYRATLRLGASSTTGDPEGEIIEDQGYSSPSLERIIDVLSTFQGDILQTPPIYSALKIGGVPAYKRVRQGETVVMEPRTVYIESIKLAVWNSPYLEIVVQCGSGTYIRSLAVDIGKALGTSAYLTKLVRTRIWQPQNPEVDFNLVGATLLP